MPQATHGAVSCNSPYMDEEIGECGSLQQTLGTGSVEGLAPRTFYVTDELFPRCHSVLSPSGLVQLQTGRTCNGNW